MKVLVVEDNVVSQKVVKMMLENLGYEVETAENGQNAWNLLQEDNFHMVMRILIPEKVNETEFLARIVYNSDIDPKQYLYCKLLGCQFREQY